MNKILVFTCITFMLSVDVLARSCPQCGYVMGSGDNFCESCGRRKNDAWGNRMTYGGTPVMLTTLASGPGLGIFGNPMIRVYGVDLGLASMTEEVYGISVAGANVAMEVYGLKAGAITSAEVMCGIEVGVLNFVTSDSVGVLNGLQIGLWNGARYVTGVQIGAINVATSMDYGVQIGLINYIERSAVPFLPVFNCYF